MPPAPIGEAISYPRSTWTALSRYLDAGFLSIDNNVRENAIRPIAMGRNYVESPIMLTSHEKSLSPSWLAYKSGPHNPEAFRDGSTSLPMAVLLVDGDRYFDLDGFRLRGA